MSSAQPTGRSALLDLGLAKTFRRVGWLGFWVQIIIGTIPVAVGLAVFTFNRSAMFPGGRVDIVGYFSLFSLLILIFSTLWFFRYTRIGRQLEHGSHSWTHRRLTRTVGIGLAACSVGILFSTVVMIVEVTTLLIQVLRTPQAGIPLIQTTPGAGGTFWITALDIQSLMALILIVAAEIIVLVLGLFLLYQVATREAEIADTIQA